jgi:hypothetical protein
MGSFQAFGSGSLMSEVEMGDGVKEQTCKSEHKGGDAEPEEDVSALILARRGRGNPNDQVDAAK